jgi:hypothetical protein
MVAYPLDHYGSDNSDYNFSKNMNTLPVQSNNINMQPMAHLSLGIAPLNIQNGHV